MIKLVRQIEGSQLFDELNRNNLFLHNDNNNFDSKKVFIFQILFHQFVHGIKRNMGLMPTAATKNMK